MAAVVAAALVPAAATAAVFAPELFRNAAETAELSGVVKVGWLVLLLVAAPLAAAVVNLLRPVATNNDRAMWLALPQVAVFPALLSFDVWLDIRRGDLLRGEDAADYGIFVTLGLFAGVVVTGLTAAGARYGAKRAGRRARRPEDAA